MLELWKSKAWYVSDVLQSVYLNLYIYHSKLSSNKHSCIFWEQRLTLTLHNTTCQNITNACNCKETGCHHCLSYTKFGSSCQHYIIVMVCSMCKKQVRMSEFADYTIKIPSLIYTINITLNQVLSCI